jgi:hypothetical protein
MKPKRFLLTLFIESVTGEDVADKVQFGAEYYPPGWLFSAFHQSPQSPAYVKKREI